MRDDGKSDGHLRMGALGVILSMSAGLGLAGPFGSRHARSESPRMNKRSPTVRSKQEKAKICRNQAARKARRIARSARKELKK